MIQLWRYCHRRWAGPKGRAQITAPSSRSVDGQRDLNHDLTAPSHPEELNLVKGMEIGVEMASVVPAVDTNSGQAGAKARAASSTAVMIDAR